MAEKYQSSFGIIDNCMFAGVLIISTSIGFFVSYQGNKSPEEFLLGNRSFKSLPVAMSLFTTYFSAISLLGYSGEAYTHGMQLSMMIIGIMLANIFSTYLILPTVYPLKIISINEYVELRFKSKRLCQFFSFINVLKNTIQGAICLFASTIALASMTNFSTLTNILLLGSICTLYSSIGGFKAIIWTDVFQFFLMVIGIGMVVAIGFYQNGGIIETLHTASNGGRLEMFDMNLSPFVLHTFFNTIAMGFFMYLPVYTSDQVLFQRISSVKTFKNAKRVMSYNIFGIFVIYFSIFMCGLIAYVSYAGCDPMLLGKLKRKEEILPYFVMNKMGSIPGLSGIFVSAIISGLLSTLSSFTNSNVAQIWRDFFLKFEHFQTASSSYATLVNKIISLVVGTVIIGLAILISKVGSVIEIMIIATGVFSGPILGVFFIGYFLPRCNLKSVWTGLILSFVLILWIALGGWYYKTPVKTLPFSVDECDISNFTSINISKSDEFYHISNNNSGNSTSDESFFKLLYKISYTLYGTISTLLCIILAVLFSFLTGNKELHETSPKFISPYVRKFYWTKEELETIEKNDRELDTFNISVRESNLDNCLYNLRNSEDN